MGTIRNRRFRSVRTGTWSWSRPGGKWLARHGHYHVPVLTDLLCRSSAKAMVIGIAEPHGAPFSGLSAEAKRVEHAPEHEAGPPDRLVPRYV